MNPTNLPRKGVIERTRPSPRGLAAVVDALMPLYGVRESRRFSYLSACERRVVNAFIKELERMAEEIQDDFIDSMS